MRQYIKNNYYVISYDENDKVDYQYINEKNKTNKPLVVEVRNTIGLSVDLLNSLNDDVSIRVIGPFDKKREDCYKGDPAESYFANSFERTLYTKNELIEIIKKLEKIEQNINPYWSEIEKAYYVYEYLKTNIFYDPNFKTDLVTDKDIRSLTGLLRRESVCAGFAVIYKEILNRLGLKCAYMSGIVPGGGGHCWNVLLTKDNRLIPIDVTWENCNLRDGKLHNYDFFGQNIEKFNKEHVPRKPEEKYFGCDLSSRYSEIKKDEIKQIHEISRRSKTLGKITTNFRRKDGTKFAVTLLDSSVNNDVFRFIYRDIYSDGRVGKPYMFISDTNYYRFINFKKFYEGYVDKKRIQDEKERYDFCLKSLDFFANDLMSKENIQNTLKNKSNYVGKINNHKRNFPYFNEINDIIYNKYETKKDELPIELYDKVTGEKVNDSYLTNRYLFARYWVYAVATTKKMHPQYELTTAMEENIYNTIIKTIIKNEKVPDRATLLDSLKKATNYPEINDLLSNLFNHKQARITANENVSKVRIDKSPEALKRYSMKQRHFTRSDGTFGLIIERSPKRISGKGKFDVGVYDIFEDIHESGTKYNPSFNKVFTENDLIADNRQEIADILLERKRLQGKTLETGNYLGFIDKTTGRKYDDHNWAQYFEPSSRPSDYKSSIISSKHPQDPDLDLTRILSNRLGLTGGKSILF